MDQTTKTRTKTALIAASVVFPILIWGGVNGLSLLAVGAFLLGCWELVTMATAQTKNEMISYSIAGIFYLILVTYFQPSGIFMFVFGPACFVSYWFSCAMFWLHTTNEDKDFMVASGIGVPWLWLILGLGGMCVIRTVDQGYTWLWFLLCTVWLTDIGAYFAGRAWGKTKMAPTISPGKTWIGTFGGVITATVGATTLFCQYAHLSVSPLILLGLSLMVSILAVIGDLYESLIKRAYGVKDTGTLLPGHGGVLDRLDSLLYASPVLAGTLFLIN